MTVTLPERRRSRPVPLPDPGVLRPEIVSFELALLAEGKAKRTITIYTEAATRLAGWLLNPVWPVDPQALSSKAGKRKPKDSGAKVSSELATPPPLSGLTDRELQVLEQVCDGWSNRQIADEMGVADSTISTHLGHLRRKLEARDRAHLAAIAVRSGLTTDTPGRSEEVVDWAASVTDWSDVQATHLRGYFAWLGPQYSKGYVNQQGRAIQQFFKWHANEEDLPNPMLGLKPPKPGQTVVPVLEREQLAALIKDAEKDRGFDSRRDTAILRLFASTGSRIAEIAKMRLDKNDAGMDRLDVRARSAIMLGKGNKERIIRFDHKCAMALNRYLRMRSRHRYAERPEVWLGTNNRPPLSANGIYQMIKRRGQRLGIPIWPHLFRHTFTHRWLDEGGAEGDLMELMGWSSPQMLRRYGASARGARARRHYDQVDVMGGV